MTNRMTHCEVSKSHRKPHVGFLLSTRFSIEAPRIHKYCLLSTFEIRHGNCSCFRIIGRIIIFKGHLGNKQAHCMHIVKLSKDTLVTSRHMHRAKCLNFANQKSLV